MYFLLRKIALKHLWFGVELQKILADTGKEKYRLKIKGGNPFHDEKLHNLIGKTIIAEGNVTDYFFEITNNLDEIESIN